MELIRNNIFETNSSSTHCIVLVSKDEYEKFKNNELYLDLDKDTLVDPKTKERTEKEVVFINTKLNFDWNKKTVAYKDQIVPYDNYREVLLTDDNLASITEDDIKQYHEDNGCDSDIPISFSDFDAYINDCDYYPFTEVNDSIDAVAFGYYGNNY